MRLLTSPRVLTGLCLALIASGALGAAFESGPNRAMQVVALACGLVGLVWLRWLLPWLARAARSRQDTR